jgi:hypothetical protein
MQATATQLPRTHIQKTPPPRARAWLVASGATGGTPCTEAQRNDERHTYVQLRHAFEHTPHSYQAQRTYVLLMILLK